MHQIKIQTIQTQTINQNHFNFDKWVRTFFASHKQRQWLRLNILNQLKHDKMCIVYTLQDRNRL